MFVIVLRFVFYIFFFTFYTLWIFLSTKCVFLLLNGLLCPDCQFTVTELNPPSDWSSSALLLHCYRVTVTRSCHILCIVSLVPLGSTQAFFPARRKQWRALRHTLSSFCSLAARSSLWRCPPASASSSTCEVASRLAPRASTRLATDVTSRALDLPVFLPLSVLTGQIPERGRAVLSCCPWRTRCVECQCASLGCEM